MVTSAFWKVTPPAAWGWAGQGQRTGHGIFSVRRDGGLDPGETVEMERQR